MKVSKRILAAALSLATVSGTMTAVVPVNAAKPISEIVEDSGLDIDYARALQYSMYFYDANMCGTEVDENTRLSWRGDCHTYDAHVPMQSMKDDEGNLRNGTNLSDEFMEKYKDVLDPDGDGTIDVAGGMHDAGDHVEFGMPENYAAATLGWGYYEFRDSYVKLGQDDHIETLLRYFNDYLMKCTFRDKDGKVITKNVLGKTQAEVKEKLKTAIEESQKLDPTRTGQYTVQTWVTLWYEVFIKPQIRPNTKQFYRNCMENHLFPALGDCPLEKLSTIQIQRAINEMSEHGRNHYYSHIPLKETTLSPRIVQGILGILRKSLDQAVAEKLILSNPAANCKAPKTVRKEMKVLPEELIGPYLHEAKQRGVFAPLYLELTSGLRRGELLALLWKDLNVKDRTLSVTKSVCRIDHQLVVSQPKTKNSLRLLTLPESTVQILLEEHEKHPDNPYMFPSPKTGEMLDPASFRAMHDRILEAIGAEHVRFHDMRHTFATLALKNGVDVRTLSEMLGHYSAGFTLSTYVHSTPSMRVQAADTIGQMIGREVV